MEQLLLLGASVASIFVAITMKLPGIHYVLFLLSFENKKVMVHNYIKALFVVKLNNVNSRLAF